MELFVSGSMDRCVAELVCVNFKTASYYFHRLWTIIDQATQGETSFAEEVEVDESYFGGSRKGNGVAALQAKCPSLGCSSAAVEAVAPEWPPACKRCRPARGSPSSRYVQTRD